MKIIAVAGRKYSGKDTFAKPLLVENGGKFIKVSFAQPLKDMMRSLLGSGGLPKGLIEEMLEGNLKEQPSDVLLGKTPRYAMQTLGTEWRDMLGNSLWLNIAEKKLRAMSAGGAYGAIITDMRFVHELDVMKRLGALTVRVSGGRSVINAASDHPSETAIDTLPVEIDILNFGSIDDLHSTAFVVAERVKKSNI